MEYKKVCEAEKSSFYNTDHYDKIITEDAKGFKEDGSILFIFKKNVIKKEDRSKYINLLRVLAKTKTKNRGSAAAICDVNKFPKDAVSLCNSKGMPLKNEKIVSTYYIKDNGEMAKRCQSNMVRCGVAGYFDETAGLPCRKVSWSKNNLKKHNELMPLCETISNHFKDVAPDVWDYQKSKVNENFVFKDSIFSTLTINYDFRTACHKDKGDLEGSLSTLTILEDINDNYEGFYLGLPEYKLMFDIRDGDTLIFDAHEYHCNTEYKVLSDKLPIDDLTGNNFAGRLSIVAYLRNRINVCANQEHILSEEEST
tara:strand:+ start:233 stop:1165 length:933 start_codon:yes stop_codon:yes gene_type:complete